MRYLAAARNSRAMMNETRGVGSMEKVRSSTQDLVRENIEAIAELFPNVMTESVDDEGNLVRTIDFDQLRQELSDHVVDGPQERYRLDWPGKRAAMLAANAPTRSTLRPMLEESVDFENTKNIFIEGDNLEALKVLQESYLGKVKMIYIDPPYNTGRDFIYRDNFSERSSDYLELSGQVDQEQNRLVSNVESNGRFHSSWLSMIYPRLRLARNLLSESGCIFISIDDNELPRLLLICDEIFGRNNHIASFIWKSKSGGANDSGEVAVDHEYIVCYGKSKTGEVLNLDSEATVTTNYNLSDELGRYALRRLDQQNLQYSPSMDYELIGPDGTVYKLPHKDPSRPNAIWRWSKEKVASEMDSLVFKDGNVYTKFYEQKGSKPRSLLVDERFGRTRTGSSELREVLNGTFFDNPKPTRLLQFLINIATDSDSIVLDFFAGSGSLAHAVLIANAKDGGCRRWVSVQLPESDSLNKDATDSGFSNIAEIARERIRRVDEKISVEAGLTWSGNVSGFRAFRVDSGAYQEVLLPAVETTQEILLPSANNLKSDRSEWDLLFQVILDAGVDPGLPITVNHEGVAKIFVVDEGALAVCFDEEIDEGVIRLMAKSAPLRAVLRDSSFISDAQRINVEQVFRELSPDTQVRVI